MSSPTTTPDIGRKYKSRGQPPCDACRKRRICCVRLPGAVDCALCQTREVHCTYKSVPVPKHGRGPSRRQRAAAAGAPATAAAATTTTKSTHTTGMSPSTNSATLTEPTRWITQFLGLSGDQDPFVLRHCTFDADCYKRLDWACLRVSSANAGSDNDIPAQFAVVPDTHLDARPAYYPSADVWAALMGGPERQLLLGVYTQTIHSSFPLLDPQQLLPHVPDHRDSRSLLLASMCALAAPFARTCPMAHRQALYQYVFEALPIERRHPRLEVVEAALVFVQRHASIHRAPTTPGLWSEVGAVVGMCHELGLHVDPSGWQITRQHRNRRIRLWWATYVLATFGALGLGRPSYIHAGDWNVPMLGSEHFTSTSEASRSEGGLSPPATSSEARTERARTKEGEVNFIIMARLATVLARLLTEMYSLAAVEKLRKATAEEVHSLFLGFQADLYEVRAEIDRRPSMTAAFLDSSGFVRLAFHAVEIALCRATLRHLDVSFSEYGSVRQYARATVESVVTLLRTLQINQMRAYWWNPMSQIHFSLAGSFLFYLLLSSTDEDEIEYWTATIREYRQLLELDHYGFPVTRLAATRMALLATVNGDGDSPSKETDKAAQRLLNGDSSEGEYFDGDLKVELG